MAEHHQFKMPTLTAKQLLKLEKIKLQQEQAKAKQKEEERLTEAAKAKQEEARLKRIEYEAQIASKTTKGRRVASKKLQRESSSEDYETQKRLKTNHEQGTSSTVSSSSSNMGSVNWIYFSTNIQPTLKLWSIPSELRDCDDISDDLVQVFEDSFKPCILLKRLLEKNIEDAMGQFIPNLFEKCKDATSLKYIKASDYAYLNAQDMLHRNAPGYERGPSAAKPDCTFIFKNLNIIIKDDNEFQALQDFVIYLGELKAFSVDIDRTDSIVQICRYLGAVLDIQNREKVYGFITSLRQIRFYCVERRNNVSYFHQSPKLEFIDEQSEEKSSIASAAAAVYEQVLSEEKQERRFNKDTIKIFIKFLIMNPTFYGYNMLTINPDENLFPGSYFIKARLGVGLTSIVYELINKENGKTSRALKMCRKKEFCHIFLNEFAMLKKLKQFNDPNNFNKFFSNIEQASLEGNFLLFDKVLISMTSRRRPIISFETNEAQQLISIMEYLYQCRIIHRDIRPENIMYDMDHQHIKLIDFGFAAAFEDDENTKELEIAGVVSCGGIKFLKFYSEQLANMEEYITYEYERTFDLQCSLNVIMYMNNLTISDTVKHSTSLQLKERIDKLYEIWLSVKNKNKTYNKLLDLIEKVSSLSDFQLIKDLIELLF